MRKLERIRTKKAIPSSFRGEYRIRWNEELLRHQRDILKGLAEGKEVKREFEEERWKVCKAQLLHETHQKCAYCDTPTRIVSYGDVEHYRPKSIYWWLAYCYDNYLAACISCNQEYKKDKFPHLGVKMPEPPISATTTDEEIERMVSSINPHPLKSAKGKDWDEFHAEHEKEIPLLLNPYLHEVEEFLEYEIDDFLREVEIKIKPTKSNYQDYQKALDENYGLNRKELKVYRYMYYKIWRTCKKTLADSGISDSTKQENEELLVMIHQPEFPYSGMIRYFENL